MTESVKRMQKLNFIKMVWPQFNLFHIFWSQTCQIILWVFISRLLCENGWGYIEYKGMFYTTFYARKKVENTFLPKSNGLATKRRQNRFTFV